MILSYLFLSSIRLYEVQNYLFLDRIVAYILNIMYCTALYICFAFSDKIDSIYSMN